MLSVTWPPTSIFFPVPKYIFVPEIHRQHIHTYIHTLSGQNAEPFNFKPDSKQSNR